MAGALIGKLAGIFFTTDIQSGGQETTAFTSLTFLAHHGMIYGPLGYQSPLLFNMEEIHGGSAWGAGTFAGMDDSRQPSELELDLAELQGESFAQVARKLSISSVVGCICFKCYALFYNSMFVARRMKGVCHLIK